MFTAGESWGLASVCVNCYCCSRGGFENIGGAVMKKENLCKVSSPPCLLHLLILSFPIISSISTIYPPLLFSTPIFFFCLFLRPFPTPSQIIASFLPFSLLLHFIFCLLSSTLPSFIPLPSPLHFYCAPLLL